MHARLGTELDSRRVGGGASARPRRRSRCSSTLRRHDLDLQGALRHRAGGAERERLAQRLHHGPGDVRLTAPERPPRVAKRRHHRLRLRPIPRVHLAIHGDQQRITLDDLTAKSGDGSAHLSGSAERTSDGYQLAAQSQVSRFLLYQEGQPLARFSVDGSLSGTAKPGRTEIGVDIKDAHVELSDVQRRNLQSLTPPRDVVMVENGVPKGRPEAEKLHALAARVAGVASPSPAPARRRELVAGRRRGHLANGPADLGERQGRQARAGRRARDAHRHRRARPPVRDHHRSTRPGPRAGAALRRPRGLDPALERPGRQARAGRGSSIRQHQRGRQRHHHGERLAGSDECFRAVAEPAGSDDFATLCADHFRAPRRRGGPRRKPSVLGHERSRLAAGRSHRSRAAERRWRASCRSTSSPSNLAAAPASPAPRSRRAAT